MSRQIDGDELIKVLEEEIRLNLESDVKGDCTYLRGVFNGHRVGLRNAISIIKVMLEKQAIKEAGRPTE